MLIEICPPDADKNPMSRNLAFAAILAVAGVTFWSRSPDVKTAPSVEVPKSERVRWISRDGDEVEIADFLPADGGWTVVEFTGDW